MTFVHFLFVFSIWLIDMQEDALKAGAISAVDVSVLLLASCGRGISGGDDGSSQVEPETTVPELPADAMAPSISLATSVGGPCIALSSPNLTLGSGYGFRVDKNSPLQRALAFDRAGNAQSVDLTERVAIGAAFSRIANVLDCSSYRIRKNDVS